MLKRSERKLDFAFSDLSGFCFSQICAGKTESNPVIRVHGHANIEQLQIPLLDKAA